MKELLSHIADGQTVFEPENGDLAGFQELVNTLRRAYVHGYIGFFKVHQDIASGMYTKLVSGGLTPVGIRYLDALEQSFYSDAGLFSSNSSDRLERLANVN